MENNNRNNNKRPIFILLFIIALGIFVRPPVIGGNLTSWWGIRPGGLDGWFHSGSDIGHAVGTPVNPVSSGTVKETGYDDNRGNFVNVSHLVIFESRYHHLNSVETKTGEKVNNKIVIGTVGNTGLSTGPHLHFEIRLFIVPLPGYLLTLPGRGVNALLKLLPEDFLQKDAEE